MYCIYLYSDTRYSRTNSVYGYWVGKSYIVEGEEYPICENTSYKRKEYKSLKRAVSSGHSAVYKYGYVHGFDVEDENGNVLYKSYESLSDKRKTDNHFTINDVQL